MIEAQNLYKKLTNDGSGGSLLLPRRFGLVGPDGPETTPFARCVALKPHRPAMALYPHRWL
jgi:hypothetical protein